MMLVITISCCPPKLRGDLTKWLIEIDTGVFVGNLNPRVRESVWNRICSNIGSGRATMVFGTNGEQKLDFKTWNSDWVPVDYDGITLVRRNLPEIKNDFDNGYSKAKQNHINRLSQMKKVPKKTTSYVVIDVETTGLQDSDKIIEIGALKVDDGQISECFSTLVKCEKSIPKEIVQITGITDEMLCKQGINIKEAINKLTAFCGDSELIGHNIGFDMQFLRRAIQENGLPPMNNRTNDTMRMARRKLDCDSGYGLMAVAENLGIQVEKTHRAEDDCLLTYRIFEKLNRTFPKD